MCYFCHQICRYGKITLNCNNSTRNIIASDDITDEHQESVEAPQNLNDHHPRYSDTERKDGRSETETPDPEADLLDNQEGIPECGGGGTDNDNDDTVADLQPWRGMLRKTDSKINVNE